MTELAIQFDPDSAHFGASRSQKRIEDDRLLTGRGLYSDDREFPEAAALVLLRSPYAHARVTSIDLADARGAPGVLAAWSMEDLKRDGLGHIPFPPLFKQADGSPMEAPLRTLLADGTVYHVGQAVVAIVAQTREQAQDAAERVMIDFEELPCVTDPRRAIEPGAPQLWPGAPNNIAAESRYGDAKVMDDAIAVHAFERTTLYTQNQTSTGARQLLGDVFKTKPEDFRIIVGDIGGGFGMKTGLTPEDALVCYAARKLGRPVKWRGERSEEFLAAHMGRDQHYAAVLALDKDGKILGLRMRMIANIGAVPVGSSAIIPLALGPKVQATVYHVPVIDYHVRAVLTNTMATGAYRGAGRPEANYLMERLMDRAAREMKIDPVALRRRNFIRPAQFPYTTHLGETYDVGDFARVLDRALEVADWTGYPQRAAESRRRGKLRGRGLSSYLEWTGALPTETVDIQIDADGTVTVFSGTQAMGQGLETTYAQLITEVLQIPIERIEIVQGDTDRANGVGSVGSRSAFVGGSAVVAAGREVIVRGKQLAAELLEAAPGDIEYGDGRFRIAGTDRAIALAELATRQPDRIVRVSATQTPSTPSWPNGAQVCEVEIDEETGTVEVVRHSSCDDLGRIINHPIVEGQVHGGVAQGLGQALFEQAVYDESSGQLLTGSLMDYAVPRASDLPPVQCVFEEGIPCKTNLLGVKGCGEIGTIGSVPAAVHAVLDALAERGVSHLEMPLTPERIWRALHAG